MPYRIELSPEALGHIEAAMQWWDENRPNSPGLLLDELEAAFHQLTMLPRSGKPYEPAQISGMRRLLMPRTRYHLYYTLIDEESLIRVHALWHASRRSGPRL